MRPQKPITPSIVVAKSGSLSAKKPSTAPLRKSKSAWGARHSKLAHKIGFEILKNGEIRSTARYRFPTHEDAIEFVKTSKHWLCERARIEAVRRMMLWNSQNQSSGF